MQLMTIITLILGILCGLTPQDTFVSHKFLGKERPMANHQTKGSEQLLRWISKPQLYISTLILLTALWRQNTNLMVLFMGMVLVAAPLLWTDFSARIITRIGHLAGVAAIMLLLLIISNRISPQYDASNIYPYSSYIFVGIVSVTLVMFIINLGSWGYLFQLLVVVSFVIFYGPEGLGDALFPMMFLLGTLISTQGMNLNHSSAHRLKNSVLTYQAATVVSLLVMVFCQVI